MRVSEGVPRGKIAELYNPGMFDEHEEVIVFTRDEFSRTYTSMREQIEYINKTELHLKRSEEWKLMGYWPKMMERIHIIDKNMNMLLTERPQQAYLDAFLYGAHTRVKTKQHVIKEKVPIQQTLF